MNLNLLLHPWVPVYLSDGTKDKIAPYEIGEKRNGNPPVRLAFNRSDLDATLMEFLIGVLQTFYPPDEQIEGRDWVSIYQTPPTPKILKETFNKKDSSGEPFSSYFNLIGSGKRFMQDKSLSQKKENDKILPPDVLFLDYDANQSHFRKRRYKYLCFSCAGAALYTLQVRANSGGSGHMQNMRSGNAFTTIVKGETLWKTCWINVLGKSELERYGNGSSDITKELFPWTNDSTKGRTLKHEDISPLHSFWQMPRRIYFSSIDHKTCGLCNETGPCVVGIKSSPKGIQYRGNNCFHPLSIREKKTKKDGTIYYKFFDHKEYGTRYKDWLALTHNEPAACIATAVKRKKAHTLWAFGYVCKSKLALAWDEGVLPVIKLPSDDELEKKDFIEAVGKMLKMAAKTADSLKDCVGKALALIAKESKKKVKFSDKTVFTSQFWVCSEEDFYESVKELNKVFVEKEDIGEVFLRWKYQVSKHALNVFDGLIKPSSFEFETVRIVAERRAMLESELNKLYKPKIRKGGKRGKKVDKV